MVAAEVAYAGVLQPIRQMRGQVPIPRAHVLVPLIRAQWKEARKHHHRLEGCEHCPVLSAESSQILILRG